MFNIFTLSLLLALALTLWRLSAVKKRSRQEWEAHCQQMQRSAEIQAELERDLARASRDARNWRTLNADEVGQ